MTGCEWQGKHGMDDEPSKEYYEATKGYWEVMVTATTSTRY